MRPLYGHNDTVASLVAELTPGCERGFGPNIQAMGVIDDDGKLVAGVVYHNYDPECGIIEISGAAITPRWLQRNILREMFSNAFVAFECQLVVMRVRHDNTRLLRQLANYGFVFHRIPRLFGRHADGVVCTLTDDAWTNNRFNRPREAA